MMNKRSYMIFSFLFVFSTLILAPVDRAGASYSAAYEERINSQARAKELMIQQIMDQRGKLLLEKPENYDSEYEKLGKQLQSLGVKFLTAQEVQAKISNNKNKNGLVTPMVTLPNQDNIVWSSFRVNYIKDGVTYEVEHVTAEPNAKPSILKQTGNKTVKSSNQMQAGAMSLLKTIVSAFLGALDQRIDIALTVYDAVRSVVSEIQPATVITNIEVSYNWNYAERVNFMFVKRSGQSDSYQELSYVATYVFGTIGWTIPAFSYYSNGAIKSAGLLQDNKSNSYTGQGYLNGSYAVNNYLDVYGNYPDNGYVPDIGLEGPNNQVFHTLITVKPIGMGQIY